MSYVDAFYDKDKDVVRVVERVAGKRIYVEYPAEYTFYFNDARGKYRTVYGNPVGKFTTRSSKEFQREKRMHRKDAIYESDIRPVPRCLEKNYKGAEFPILHTAFFDIETDFDVIKGHSPPDDPFNGITAISTYLNWTDQLITQVIAPQCLSHEEAQAICNEFDNTILYTDEREMLKDFFTIIEDADVLSGWNSEGFDIPYIVNRTAKILSKDDTRRLCLWDLKPKARTFERFGAESVTYDLLGRVHLDYMQLYRKYTYHEMHSYSLDAIGEYELNERKVAYSGTLDNLYKTDFRKFIDYSRQDTALLDKLDKKLKFIDLANSIAHENTVPILKTMGAVAVTDQAIINAAHEQGFVVSDNDRESGSDSQAAGAYVAYPKKGLHQWVGSVDINSLYPSAIQALNMAPETIVGQLRPVMTDMYIAEQMADKVNVNTGKSKVGAKFAAAWEGLFGSLEYTAVMEKREDVKIIIDWDTRTSQGDLLSTFTALTGSSEVSAKDVYDLIFESGQPWVLSANGTIFSVAKIGIIPGLLQRWYAERKVLQRNKKFWDEVDKGIALPDDLLDICELL